MPLLCFILKIIKHPAAQKNIVIKYPIVRDKIKEEQTVINHTQRLSLLIRKPKVWHPNCLRNSNQYRGTELFNILR